MPQILIVDDDRSVRGFLKELFEQKGYQVTEAENGLEGIRCFRDRLTDLVIVDLHMPHMNGFEMIQALQHASPAVKIIAISGAGATDLELARQLGAQHTFQKPFVLPDLLHMVQAVLGLSSA